MFCLSAGKSTSSRFTISRRPTNLCSNSIYNSDWTLNEKGTDDLEDEISSIKKKNKKTEEQE